MTEPSETKSKIEPSLILGVASFCLSIIVAMMSFSNASDARFVTINQRFIEMERHQDDTNKRVCRLEAVGRLGDCKP